MGVVLPEADAQKLTSQGWYLLPSSAVERGRAFEQLVPRILFETGIATPVSGPSAVHLAVPGQWDGIVIHDECYHLLETKAYLLPLDSVPKLDRRCREAHQCGLGGVLVVSLSGFRPTAADSSPQGVRLLAFSDIVPCLPASTVRTSTGDRYTVTPEGLLHSSGALVRCGPLRMRPVGHGVALIDDRTSRALTRASLFARSGEGVSLKQFPPFGIITREPGPLWEVEEMIRGFYSPPLPRLQRVLGGEGEFSLSNLPPRLAKNLHAAVTHCGRYPIPVSKAEACHRVLGFPPIAMWCRTREATSDRKAAQVALRERWEPWFPYSACPFNSNKALASDRYLQACGVHFS